MFTNQIDNPDETLGQIFKEFFTCPFKWNYRTTRRSYWIGFLLNILLNFVINLILGKLPILMFLLIGYLALCDLGMSIRRLHDSNHSGLWYLIAAVPIIGLIWQIVLLCAGSTESDWDEYVFDDEE